MVDVQGLKRLDQPARFVPLPGCQGLVRPDATWALGATAGQAAWSLPIPNTQSLSGLGFFVQALVLDPGVNAAGAVVTNGGEAVIR